MNSRSALQISTMAWSCVATLRSSCATFERTGEIATLAQWVGLLLLPGRRAEGAGAGDGGVAEFGTDVVERGVEVLVALGFLHAEHVELRLRGEIAGADAEQSDGRARLGRDPFV